jgi:hypothetical protein
VSNGLLTSAIGVKLTYYVRSDYSTEWELAFANAITDAVVNVSELAYSYTFAIDDELKKNILGDIFYYVITIVVMIAYASIATSKMNCNFIADRSFLGHAGIFAAVLSVVSSIGFVSLCGVKIMNIVAIMPFLVIGK